MNLSVDKELFSETCVSENINKESIYTLPQLYKGLVISRPSKVCKSPYLADVKIFDNNGNIIEENVMAHSPALGCCGLITTNVHVLCTKSESIKNKSKYVIHSIIQENNDIIGTNPMLANPIVKSLLLNNKIEEFQNITKLKAEITINESRFDYTFLNEHGQTVYLEVKNVPLAYVIDIDPKYRKDIDLSQYDLSKKIAIFPDGYRKNKSETISVRALKHVNHLASIHNENPDIICALLFLIQRNDVDSFKPSSLDPIYEKALYNAYESGVKILPICVEWIDNKCYFLKKINLLNK
jgi:DNA-binding sugar fermentation-stimulating protein